MTTTIKTVKLETAHGTVEVASVTSHVCQHYGRTYYTTHRYNSLGQKIHGGSQFPASDATLCKFYGVPVIAK